MRSKTPSPPPSTVPRRSSVALVLSCILAGLLSGCDTLSYDTATLARIVDTSDSEHSPLKTFVLGELEEQRWEFKNTGSIFAIVSI